MADVAALNKRFGIPGVVEVVAGRGGMAAVVVGNSRDGVSGTVYLHGGHVTTWRPAGFEEVLMVSGKSSWEAGKPIRGGVPVIFPWFGPRANAPAAPVVSPMHGFARLREWEIESIQQGGEGVVVTLVMRSDEATRATWPFDFVLRHRVTFGRQLTMALEIANTGQAALTAEEAQHTYFSVADARQIKIGGLSGVTYFDKGDGMKVRVQEGDIALTGETDRIYVETTGAVTIADAARRRRIRVKKENSRTTVVWNPWIEKAKAMADFGDEEWPGMMCVETCNVLKYAVTVAPGQRHIMMTVISVEAMQATSDNG